MAGLAAELPEFNANAAPGPLAENPVLPDTTIFAPPPVFPAAEASLAIPGDATSKPSSLAEAFERLAFPEKLRESLLSMVGADVDDDPAVVAPLPFDVFRDAVTTELVLSDGSSPTLFEKGRLFKFFKDLMKIFSAPALFPIETFVQPFSCFVLSTSCVHLDDNGSWCP